MATKFMETPDATQALQFWTGNAGSVTYDTSASRKPSGLASWKCDSGAGDATAYLYITLSGSTRVSAHFYLEHLPSSSDAVILGLYSTNALNVRVTSAGVLRLYEYATQVGSDGSTLSAGTLYRICLATTGSVAKVYLDGDEDISGSTIRGVPDLRVGWGTAPGANKIINFSHTYIDDDTSGDDTGDIRVTAKLPGAVNNDNYDNADGTGAINERPIDEANCKHHDAKSAVWQDYTLETASAGDVDISGDTVVAFCGWMWSMHSKDGDTYYLILDGQTSAAWSDQVVATLNTQILSGQGYPDNAAGIGQRSGAGAPDDYLYECGTLIAYTVSAAPPAAVGFGIVV